MRPTSLCSVTLIAFALCGCGETAKTNQPAGKTKDAASKGSPKAKDASNNKTGAGNDKKPAVQVVETAKGKIKIILFSKNELVIYKDGEDDLKFDVAPTAKVTLDDQEAKFTELRVDQIAEVVYLKENQKNIAVTIRAFKEPVTKQGSVVVGPIPVIGGGTKTTSSGSLKDQIVGKWTCSIQLGNSESAISYEFTKDGNVTLTTVTMQNGQVFNNTPAQGSYKVLSDKQIDLALSTGRLTVDVIIMGDDLQLGQARDPVSGKPYIYKKVK
jgi:hypothetical protein